MSAEVNHPAHYGGADNPYEAIKVIDAWRLGFALGNAVKYISRAGKKPGADALDDLRKAAWYINHAIKQLAPPAETPAPTLAPGRPTWGGGPAVQLSTPAGLTMVGHGLFAAREPGGNLVIECFWPIAPEVRGTRIIVQCADLPGLLRAIEG